MKWRESSKYFFSSSPTTNLGWKGKKKRLGKEPDGIYI
jgi:hypothetical protein